MVNMPFKLMQFTFIARIDYIGLNASMQNGKNGLSEHYQENMEKKEGQNRREKRL